MWSEEFCECFKMTYGINSHGSAYINNFGVAAMSVAVALAPQTLDKLSAAISAALAPAAQLIPNFM